MRPQQTKLKIMTKDKVIEIINAKGVEQLKNIFALVAERITPENIPTYCPDAKEGLEFEWDETPYFCANIEKELKGYFGEGCELCFDCDQCWYFYFDSDGEEVRLLDLENTIGYIHDMDELPTRYCCADKKGNDVGLNEEPFKEAAMKKYNASSKE